MEQFKGDLCAVPIQDFAAAAAVRDLQLAFDPHGQKVLSPEQARTAKDFLDLVIKAVYQSK